MKEIDKITYVAPSTQVFEVKAEGVICTSNVNASMNGEWEEEDA